MGLSDDAQDPDGAADGADPAPDDAAMPACDGDWIVADSTGFVAAVSNASGITGHWYLHRDCDDYAAGEAGAATPGKNCSNVSAPIPGTPFTPDPGTSHMCTSGSTVHVLSMDELATEWGAYVALDLNDDATGVARDFDAKAVGLQGFCVYILGSQVPAFRIRFVSDQGITGEDWYGETLQHEGWHRVLFRDLAQVKPGGPPFDASRITAIQVEIPASQVEAIPWDFCVEGLVAIK
jgi:hypothetical protein